MLRALIFGYIIAGPLFNLVYNTKEVIRTFGCTSQLTYNLTKTRFDLMFKPFQQVPILPPKITELTVVSNYHWYCKAIFAMKADANEIKDTLSSVRDLMSPIVEEVEGEEEMIRLKEENDYLDELQGDTKRSKEIDEKHEKKIEQAKSDADVYEAKYKKKIEARCEEQLSRGSGRCRDMFGEAYNKCYDKVSVFVAWLLCWPMKLTFVCNLVQALGGSNICDPEGKVDSGIGEGYAALKSAREEFSRSLKDAKLQYKVKKPPVILDLQDSAHATKAVMHEFVVRKRLFESVMTMIKRCLSFVFLKIILGAQSYNEKYLRDIEYDNVYVTPYFRKIDARRKARGSRTLLPLKKIERKKFVDPYSLKPSKAEGFHVTGQVVKVLLELVTATIFVILDWLLYEVLDVIRKFAYMESTVFFFLLIFLSVYTERMRRGICSFFYRRREKRRVLYLYNESLRRRIAYAKFMKAKVKSMVRTRHLENEVDFWLAVRLKWPKYFGWLNYFDFARERCLICGDPEPRRGPRYRQCTTPGCNFLYCAECWRDVGRICYACTEFSDTETEEYDTQRSDF
ncbi:DC-STAMP domain-containing protein 1 [Eufriesea mexicana]|uniref:DC-STAMP domain-containing protein 1 n=1 Tax=Eufriesea mexicana TaxID=516756 RepID=A0A310S935_9HYME|nr:DC-STAMP domain-containing protein 1 [Eufriesea mexicana]